MIHQYYKSIQFARFNISSKGILWTRIEEEFTPHIITFFSERFPDFYIMIEHLGRTYLTRKGEPLSVYNDKVENVIRKYESLLPDNDLAKSLEVDNSELWNTFYDSQYVKERKNTRLFHKYIPKYLRSVKTLDKEFESLNPCKKLKDFL
ncbi:Uncharacterised protein [Candidatus Tiddalikarchaeum anstoanum]|nr:Uncharacterised protein [Candidatus Tiddalikarchaeum anstoanum]